MKGFAKVLMLLTLPAMVMVGCSTTKKKEDASSQKNQSATTAAPSASASKPMDASPSSTPAPVQQPMSGDSLSDPNSLLAKRVVFFDYDSNVVKDEFTPVLEAHASYLTSHPNAKVVLEGHTDERGTREYNLALGERRAKAVAQYLSLLGASAAQIESVSFGEERPSVEGFDESAWGKNRRVEIVYQGR